MEPSIEPWSVASTAEEAFLDMLTEASPDMTAGSAEVTRNLTAFEHGGADAVPSTRFGDEREVPYREKAFAELRAVRPDLFAEQRSVMSAILHRDAGAITPWMNRQIPVATFATHARSEFAVHRWDCVGDDELGDTLLSPKSDGQFDAAPDRCRKRALSAIPTGYS